MGELGGSGWVALIGVVTGLVALATLLAKVIERLIKERKEKSNGTSDLKYRLTKSGNTTDIALQSNAIRELAADLDDLRKAIYDVKGSTTKDIPHTLERVEGKIDSVVAFQKDEIKEMLVVLRGLKTSLDGSTSATLALRDFLVAKTKHE